VGAEIAMSPAAAKQQRTYEYGQGRFRTALLILSVLLMLAVVYSMTWGAVRVPVHDLLWAMQGKRPLTTEEHAILFEIRLPRILAAGCVGCALSIAGLLFQGLFRNPLADPYVIGSSGGAVLGASIGMFVLPQFSMWGFSATALLAFGGSVGTIGLVYWLARIGGRTSVVPLLLAGFAVSTMLGYSSYFVDILNRDYGMGRVLASWLHGVISVPQWGQLVVIFVMLLVGSGLSYPLMRRLNTLALGDEYAQQLGVHVEATRVAIILTGAMLTAAAVALGGLISFVGLIVPHLARMILGPEHTRLLPVTALSGALFLVITDTLARTLLAPSEIPVGVLMAFLGGPFFLYLLRRTKRDYSL
jgi:ABC-type Fe3+-siderophore transport system permease subunit